MAKRPLPTPEELRQLLRYDPHTGKLFWLPRSREMFESDRICRSWNTQFAGKEALTSHARGYCRGEVLRHCLAAHRVIWAIVHGAWPAGEIDHINNNPSDNRLANLRHVTRSQNQMNARKHKDGTTGFKGVTYRKDTGSFMARIWVRNECRHLGSYPTAEAAYAAYYDAAQVLHGSYANP